MGGWETRLQNPWQNLIHQLFQHPLLLHPDRAGPPLQFRFEGAEEPCFDGVPHEHATTLNKGHGRTERRKCWTISDPACLGYLNASGEWLGLWSVTKVVCRRETTTGARVQSRYYISSLDGSAQRLLVEARAHWSIENSLQWSMDVTFREDQSRVHKDHAPQNMATLRQISHNLLKREPSLKVAIQGKRLQAGWRKDYLLKVLLSIPMPAFRAVQV